MDNPGFSDLDDDENTDDPTEDSIGYKGETIFALTSGRTQSDSPFHPSPLDLLVRPPLEVQSETNTTNRPQTASPSSSLPDRVGAVIDKDALGISSNCDTTEQSYHFEDDTTNEILRSTGKRLLKEEKDRERQLEKRARLMEESESFDKSFDKQTFEQQNKQKHYNSYSSINSFDRSLEHFINGSFQRDNSDERPENDDRQSRDESHEYIDNESRTHSATLSQRNDNTRNDHSSKASLDYTEKTEQTIETSKDKMTSYTNENSYSDGYFDQSIDKIYERYNKRKCLEDQQSMSRDSSSRDAPTGCFDSTRGSQNDIKQMSFFKRCTQKKYIVLSSTALCMMLAAILAVILTVNVFHVTGHNRHYHGDPGKTENSAEMYQKAAISSDSGNCSRIGVEILRKNGSAVDAAITTAFCIGVTNRHASGIGGGGYLLVYNRENRSFEAFDFRESAPGRIQSNAYDKDNNASRYGGLAIGVPGEVKGLYSVWKKYGKLPWKELVQPAIDLAKYGVTVTPSVHFIIYSMLNMIQADPGLSKLLLNSNGEPLDIGANMVDEELAETLKIISEKPDDFYNGELASKIVADVAEAGGIISFDDLANYRVLSREVVHDTIDDFDLHTIGAPTGGPVVISFLNILKGYKFKSEDIEAKNEALTYHRMIEAMKFAFALKTREGDPSFYGDYMKELVSNMTNEEFGLVLRRKINDSSAQDLMYYSPTYNLPNENGTTHISIVAENGDAVALTTTINQWYGSLNRSLRTGIIYNNEMNDFSMVVQEPTTNTTTNITLPPSPINSVHSGKRPVSSTSAIIMTDTQGDVRFVIGGTGGMRIFPSVAQVIINKLWFKDDLGTAMSRARVYNFLQDGITYVEPDLVDIIEGLRQRNHTVEIINPKEYTAVQAVYVDKSGVYAKADKRKSGHTAGY